MGFCVGALKTPPHLRRGRYLAGLGLHVKKGKESGHGFVTKFLIEIGVHFSPTSSFGNSKSCRRKSTKIFWFSGWIPTNKVFIIGGGPKQVGLLSFLIKALKLSKIFD